MNSCIHGHELTAENTYIRPGDSYKVCRICRREAHIRYDIRRRQHPSYLPEARVDNTILREAFWRTGMSATGLAKSCGWMHKRGYGDSTAILRRLGLSCYGTRAQTTIRYTDAVRIALALGYDPTEVDL